MICHVCQEEKDKTQGCVYSDGNIKLWSCLECIKATDRIVELEAALRNLRDRLFQLSTSIKEEPWMTRLANESFRPTYGGLRECVLDLDMKLWRKTS